MIDFFTKICFYRIRLRGHVLNIRSKIYFQLSLYFQINQVIGYIPSVFVFNYKIRYTAYQLFSVYSCPYKIKNDFL